MDFKALFMLWWKAIKEPKATFSAHKGQGDFGAGVKNILLGGFFAGIILVISGGFMSIVTSPIGSFVGWVIMGAIVFLFAKLFGGKATMTDQLYLMSLYMPLLAIFSAIIALVPAISILGLLVTIYGLYLLTLVVMESHGLSMGKAIMTWLIPVIIMAMLVLVVFATFLSAFGGMFGAMGLPLEQLPFY